MSPEDTALLRELAQQVAEVAELPEMERRRADWYRHNALQPGKPLVFCSPEGSWLEINEQPEQQLQCSDEQARGWEGDLRSRLYVYRHFADDQVIDKRLLVGYAANQTGWGLEPTRHYSDTERGAWCWEGAIKSAADLEKLQDPTIEVDWVATERRLALAQEVFDGILEVSVQGRYWWSTSLIGEYAQLRGLEQIMLDMALDPPLVHATMGRLLEGRMHWLDALEAQGIMSLNNDNDYVGSGGFGFTEELPAEGYQPGNVRCRDLWGFGEAQEVVSISPAMFREFVIDYQLPLLSRFGLNCYGCCEPLHDRFEHVFQVPRLRRISISPWCDLEISAATLQDRYVFSWKPNPARLAAIKFDEELARRETRRCLEIAQGCIVEISLKDTHTCNRQPERFDRWTRIAQEEAQRAAE